MKIWIAALAAAGLMMAMAPAIAEKDTRTPLEKYQGATQFAMMNCPMSLRIALMQVEAGEPATDDANYRGCISKGQTEAKAALSAALRTIKKPKAQEALKSVHVAFLSALNGIVPEVDERKIHYEQRQTALRGKLTEAWARFEVEN